MQRNPWYSILGLDAMPLSLNSENFLSKDLPSVINRTMYNKWSQESDGTLNP